MVRELHARLQFDRLYVVAHSMGGVVALATMQYLSASGSEDFLRLFVSISTPWGGHSVAGMAVESSPVVAPSWYDMAPGSPFIEKMWTDGVPSSIEAFYLFFTYRGDTRFLAGADVGAVRIASQLDMSAQSLAEKVFGFDEGHVSVLSSEEMLAKLVEMLASAER